MSAYAIDKICSRAVIDIEFRQALQEDPHATLAATEPAPDPNLLQALLDGDVGLLSRAGATPFLLVHVARLELFGLDLERYAAAIREEYAAERAQMRVEGRLP